MAEAISIQQLKDASLDVKSLEEVVNGDENVVVTTRLGETYPSVKGSIKKVFENGVLPATPFATKALMTASALVDGKYAMVTDDTVNNGLYVKTAGAWVKSAYDPLTQAKTYTDAAKADTLSKVQNVFDTKALMLASTLPDGSKAFVGSDSTEDNNGFYNKASGVWTKSRYAPIEIAKRYTDSVASKKADTVKTTYYTDFTLGKVEYNRSITPSEDEAYSPVYKMKAGTVIRLTKKTGTYTYGIRALDTDGIDYGGFLGGKYDTTYIVTEETPYIRFYIKKGASSAPAGPLNMAHVFADVSISTSTNVVYADDLDTKLANLDLLNPVVTQTGGTFDTLVLLNESSLVDGNHAIVTNEDVSDNNGFYKKVSGAWVKSKYNPVTDSEVEAAINTAKTSAINTANTYTDSEVEAALVSANTYSDSKADANMVYTNAIKQEALNEVGELLNNNDALFETIATKAESIAFNALDTTVIDSESALSAQLVVDNGRTQSEINRAVLKSSEKTVVYLDPDELGLVKWADFKMPPYSADEYTDALNNGIRIAQAIHDANANGASEVVFDAGKYPLIYRNETGQTDFNKLVVKGAVELVDVKNMTVDFNGSTLFIIYDSNNKHQYNLSPESYAPYQLAGTLLTLKGGRNVTFKNGTIRGDQYTRSWVAGESAVEQTHGIRCLENNRNTKFLGMKFTGFRADGLSGSPRGNPIAATSALHVWTKGGISEVTGEYDDTELGAYKSARIDIQNSVIIDNRVQIIGHTYKLLPFRCNLLKVFFYGSNSVFITKRDAAQADDIIIPKGTAFIQFVATNDERTDDTITYVGRSYGISLGTGMSLGYYIDKGCEFFENMRGGISNLGGDTVVDGARFYDSGRLSKMGFKNYGDATQYGINFEDTYTKRLVVNNAQFIDVPHGVLGCCREFIVKDCLFKGIYWGAINNYSSIYAEFIGNNIQGNQNSYSEGINFIYQSSHITEGLCVIANNTLIEAGIDYNVSVCPKYSLVVKGNTIFRKNLRLVGDNNITVRDNNLIEARGFLGTSQSPFSIKGATYSTGNTMVGKITKVNSTTTIEHNSLLKGTNFLNIASDDSSTRIDAPSLDTTKLTNNVVLSSDSNLVTSIRILVNQNTGAYVDKTDNFRFDNITCDKVNLAFDGATEADYLALKITIENSVIKGGSIINIRRRQSAARNTDIVFRNTTFDLTNGLAVLKNSYTLLGDVNVLFDNCIFKSDADVSLNLVQGFKAAAVLRAKNCRFVNVTNVGNGLIIE